MKNHTRNRDVIYIHVNFPDHYVISSGIDFKEFAIANPEISNLLLLRHQYEEVNYNLHTLFDYVDNETISKLANEDVNNYGDFCWIDFDNEEALNLLEGQEIAELLYLSHSKNHLRLPFYRKLDNHFAYLAHEDGLFNKTYYRSFDNFYRVLGCSIMNKISEKAEKPMFGLRRRREFSNVPVEILYPFIENMKEGMVISLERAKYSRSQIEIPIWVIGDFYYMDEMQEEYDNLGNRPVDGKIVYDRKLKEWKCFIK
ncbi:hypothetical protein [Bacillus sp. FJAT-49736]|uniref:hypothetical protein n=1 Tax=Bacillus sp. FJAT-49736 TaxID=2833582 RepID=UPI001BC98270|nr:hypothetical protein [Bacillus sp. FJAT-49736]MBS4175467.1 hypothetical protein [Bacillus sp. FJAT-49736]